MNKVKKTPEEIEIITKNVLVAQVLRKTKRLAVKQSIKEEGLRFIDLPEQRLTVLYLKEKRDIYLISSGVFLTLSMIFP